MAQFDLYHNPSGGMAGGAPYVLDIQSDHLAALPTRIIVPLAIPEDFAPVRRLNPLVEIGDERFAVMTQFMAAVPKQVLGQPMASLAHKREDIIAALDFLFTGI